MPIRVVDPVTGFIKYHLSSEEALIVSLKDENRELKASLDDVLSRLASLEAKL